MQSDGPILVPGAALEPGTSLVDDLLLHVDEAGAVTAARNRCRHQGGRFDLSGDGCELVCARHGWVLDPSTWRYVNPVGGRAHPTIAAERTAEGDVLVWPDAEEATDRHVRQRRQPLAPGELVVELLSHACVLLTCGELVVATDPWLFGPAFLRGWWLTWEPPAGAVERVAGADLLYISHSHPDHLHRPTLEAIAAVNPDLPVLVPDFGNRRCEEALVACGLENVRTSPFDTWMALAEGTELLLFRDGSGREDSGFVLEHRGHVVVNTVDCPDPSGSLPDDVDVLLSSFAGGSSGYPVCWGELYDDATIDQKVTASLRGLEEDAVRRAVQTSCRTFVPFAGSFTEGHPADADVARRNRRNRAEDVGAAVRRARPETRVWVPAEGSTYDVGTGAVVAGPPRRRPAHDIEAWDQRIAAEADFPPLRSVEGVARYFEWAGFRGDLVLHVLETDLDLTSVVRELFVDFSGAPDVLAERPAGNHRYLRMRVRSDSFRYVLRHGLSWEELSIGFQARFYREPDRYNLDFWDHFQNALPTTTPW